MGEGHGRTLEVILEAVKRNEAEISMMKSIIIDITSMFKEELQRGADKL